MPKQKPSYLKYDIFTLFLWLLFEDVDVLWASFREICGVHWHAHNMWVLKTSVLQLGINH